ncbi:CRISPR-associated transcriptional regulator Csa3 [Thermococcus sp. P6]|uniref:CRISPR-associated CARF protein Csa3 n=1 Tax=Thermococcus sp. P6 TaxID=122420 RepID=UPI000B59B361|nr:CRISPR-associated CARF protein Csa3 [Thermococcus sp. P6]ASJ10962.1 CRISPR-associated transcriptional regulator Csa3 [Thermococcus sp. P6]
MLVVFPVGFDEKFIIRALVRNREDDVTGLKEGDRLMAILPEGYRKEQRTLSALQSIENIAVPIVGEEGLIRLEVPVDGEDTVLFIKKGLEENMPSDRIVLAVLSGGMRPLLVSTLLALLTLKDARVIVESDFENLSGYISIELGAFLAPRNRRWEHILCGLLRNESVRTISEKVGLSPATVSNELRKMREHHLIKTGKLNERVPRYVITRAGRLYLKLMEAECEGP